MTKKFTEMELLGGIFSGNFAILGGLIAQGAVDKTKLRVFLENLRDDLEGSGKDDDAYIMVLRKTIEFLEKTEGVSSSVTLQ